MTPDKINTCVHAKINKGKTKKVLGVVLENYSRPSYDENVSN
jgi:hypothetical protein